ncbi:MAG: hypothetical protein KAH17_10395 [Bacteroidales bacterium]|nr:hypothetical protein [Bacteroidales bacterium]
MRTIFSIIILAALTQGVTAQDFQKYPFKSGMIEYKTEGQASGTRVMYWDKYGFNEYAAEKSVTKMLGMTIESSSYELSLGSTSYSWEDEGPVYKSENPVADYFIEKETTSKDLQEASIEMLKGLGFEKTGKGEVLGKKCDVWEGIGSKIWVWKGFSLKSEISMLGMTISETAVKIETNSRVPASVFKVPANREIVKETELY